MKKVDSAVLVCLVLAGIVTIKFAPVITFALLLALVRYRRAIG